MTKESVERCPSLYANGFEVGLTAADVRINLLTNGNLVASLNLSFTSTKTLAQVLSNLMRDFEAVSNHPIMPIEEVNEYLEKFKQPHKDE